MCDKNLFDDIVDTWNAATDEDFDALKEGMDWILSGASGTQPSFWPD